MSRSHEVVQQEVLDRCRRIETRLTKYMEAMGFDTKVRRPIWDHGKVHIPTPTVAVRDILLVIPSEWGNRAVEVVCKGATIATLCRIGDGGNDDDAD